MRCIFLAPSMHSAPSHQHGYLLLLVSWLRSMLYFDACFASPQILVHAVLFTLPSSSLLAVGTSSPTPRV